MEQDNSVLTEKQREFLKTPDDERGEQYSHQMVSYNWRNIRDRVKSALLDFRLLTTELDDEQIEKMFDVGTPLEEGSFKYGIALLTRLALASHPQQPTLGIEPTLSPFLEEVERGIQIYLNTQHGVTADIDVSVSAVNAQPIDDYREGLEERDVPITGSERIKAHRVLENAGYSSEEIVDILGEPDEE